MALYNIAGTVLIAGINFITIPIFTRMLDTAGYGLVNIYVAWVQIFTIFVGLKADGSIGSAHANLPEEEQDSYHYSIMLLALLAFVVVLFFMVVLLHPLSQALSMSPVLTICAVVQSFGAFVISVFSMRFIFKKQAQFNFALSVGLCVATTVLSVVLILFCFLGEDAYLGRVIGLVVPNVLIAFGLFSSLALSKQRRFSISHWKFCLALTVPLVFHGLSQLLLAQSGKIAIQQCYDNSLAGVFSIAVVIVTLLNAIYNALNNAFVPFMYDDLAGKTTAEVKQRHFRNYFTSFTFGAAAFVLISPEILKLMTTEAYWSSIPVLPFLVFGQYCVFLYSFPVNYEFYKMRTKSVAIGTTCAAVINIILLFLLVPYYGMMGAAFSTMISYLLLFLFHFCIARFLLGDRNYPARYYLCGLLLMGFVCAGCLLTMDLPILRWIFAVLMLASVAFRIWKTKSVF
jgi:O-antigen/teichoic acid export membrane protein